MNLLHVDSSITGDASASRQLTAAIVSSLTARDPELRVARRDLQADPVPHLDVGHLAGLAGGAELKEFLDAEVIVIGAPMYNFTVSSQLKAWLDRLLVAGKTFRYTAEGSEGLAGGRTVIVASSRGGLYAVGGPQAAADFQEPFLRQIFAFMGVTDVRFVRAEGLALGPDQREAAISAALADIPALAGRLSLAA